MSHLLPFPDDDARMSHLLPFPDDDVRMSIETLESLSILSARDTSITDYVLLSAPPHIKVKYM